MKNAFSGKPWFLSRNPFQFRYVGTFAINKKQKTEKYTYAYLALVLPEVIHASKSIQHPPRSVLPVQNNSQHSKYSPNQERKMCPVTMYHSTFPPSSFHSSSFTSPARRGTVYAPYTSPIDYYFPCIVQYKHLSFPTSSVYLPVHLSICLKKKP